MDVVMVQVGTKLPYQTLQKVKQFAREHNIVHKTSGNVNNAEAVRRLVELALDSQADVKTLETDNERAS